MLAIVRRSRGLTQADLARRAGLSRETVANSEARRHVPAARTRRALAAALDVDPDALFTPADSEAES